MAAIITENELIHSCRVLFGDEMCVTKKFLEYLQLSGIKTAYRQKALETHPDMLKCTSKAALKKSSDLFCVVQQAYEHLSNYLDAREKGFSFYNTGHRTAAPKYTKPATAPSSKYGWANSVRPKSAYQSGTKKTKHNGFSYWHKTDTNGRKPATNKNNFNGQPGYNGQIPYRKLLFGHYLYYSGITNWQTIIKALVWQRTKRPRLGEIGRQFGWLSDKDILTILKNRKYSDSFGKSAVNMGYLSAAQLRLIIFKQKRLQKKFGQYFTQNNILTSYQLNQLVNNFYSHNTSVLSHRYNI